MSSQSSGCFSRLPQLTMIILAAILLALGGLLVVNAQSRPKLPRGSSDVLVEGRQVRIAMDPQQEVYLVPLEQGTGGQQFSQLSTGTPAILPTAPPAATIQPLPTAPPPTVTPIPQASCIIFTDYTVQAGDTLYSISRRFVTSITLMARHGISSTSLIPGHVIRIPVGDPSCCSGDWRPYVVEEGDTWSGVAAFSGITTDTLLQSNGRSSGAILYLASVICTP